VIPQTTEKGWTITLEKRPFASTYRKHLEQDLFDEYKNDIECYAAYRDGQEVGVMAMGHVQWNNTARISDIYITPSYKRLGIGRQLMQFAIERARELGARLVVLETQTSNYPAIEFYKKCGFQLIAVDTMSYSNEDLEKKDVRIELAYVLS
jgi:ribosomal protein S18 acetylase RimI-like enzyme